MTRALPLLAFAVAAALYWAVAAALLGTIEPWDSPRYPAALAGSILLGAGAGYAMPERGPWWGMIAIVAQAPVLLARGTVGPLALVGLLFLAIECVPAVLAALLAARLRRRGR